MVYKDMGSGLPPRHLGATAARIHADLVAACETPDDWRPALKMALAQLRRDLSAPPGSALSTKHSA